MDKQVFSKQINKPDYRRIYSDIIELKYPQKKEECSSFIEKKELSVLDIIRLNNILFNHLKKENLSFNQRHRSYDKAAILAILDYQKKLGLNNIQTANHFKMSRNTITKWRKLFGE